jgi:hypothetical protein
MELTMSNDEPKTLSEIILERLANWAGWPEIDWLVMTIHNRNKIPELQITHEINNLVSSGKIALIEHKNQAVLRIE